MKRTAVKLTLAALALTIAACNPQSADPPGEGAPPGGPPSAEGFVPPVGIPAPEFGIDEQPEDFYTRPDPWQEEVPGWYYVEQKHPAASDDRTYGYPGAPRATIPDPIPAGSVVVLAGDYDYAPAGYDRIVAEGTAEAPVFVVASPSGARVTKKWKLEARYLIIDGLEFTGQGRLDVAYPSHHVTVRNSELHNLENMGKIGGRGNSDTERVHDVVIYRNRIHSQENWDANPDADPDNHGIKFDAWVDRVWILENEGYHNAGSFVQVGNMYAGDLTRNRYFYIGRNRLYANRQSPIEIKQASDVIVSQNHLFENRKVQRSLQAGVYLLYGPDNVWIVGNVIHDSDAGVIAGSNSGGTGKGPYVVGNVIYNTAPPPGYEYNPNTGWALAGVMLAGGNERYVVDNTLIDVSGGIHTPSASPIHIHWNLVAGVGPGYHVFIESGGALDASTLTHNAFYQAGGTASFRLRNTTYSGVAALEAVWSHAGANLEADPRLNDPAAGDFQPRADSPLVDAGREHEVYRVFEDRYGLDIRRDAAGRVRPQGAGWDVGALEHAP